MCACVVCRNTLSLIHSLLLVQYTHPLEIESEETTLYLKLYLAKTPCYEYIYMLYALYSYSES